MARIRKKVLDQVLRQLRKEHVIMDFIVKDFKRGTLKNYIRDSMKPRVRWNTGKQMKRFFTKGGKIKKEYLERISNEFGVKVASKKNKQIDTLARKFERAKKLRSKKVLKKVRDIKKKGYLTHEKWWRK